MGQALYRTYRSKKLSEIVGQEHITQALSNALKSGAISHAYLFTGPRGVGKTSIARILAHEINQLPYDDDSTHLDIIEIDAASNRRIDEIRDLRDKVHIAPSSAKFKVYIIDEVHMLTREAFNALLKTLEEPPAHAVFILATTEVHKLPETIISRTQRFAFKPVDLDKVVAHLKHIAKSEKVKIDDDALQIIAAHGEGSFRDSISLLDQARSVGKHITKKDIESILGIAPAELINALTDAVAHHEAAVVAQTLLQLYDQGGDPAQIAKQIALVVRRSLLSKQRSIPFKEAIALLEKLIEVPASSDPRTFLEVILLDAALAGTPSVAVAPPAPAATPPAATSTPVHQTPKPDASGSSPVAAAKKEKPAPSVPEATPSTDKAPEAAAPAVPKTEAASSSAEAADAEAPVGDTLLDNATWLQTLATIKQKHNTLYSILKTAQPTFTPGSLTLEFGYAFHQKRINEKRNKKIVSDTLESITGEPIVITCVVGEPKPATPELPANGEVAHTVASTGASDAPGNIDDEVDYYIQQAEQEAASRPITAVSNIFGGGELLES